MRQILTTIIGIISICMGSIGLLILTAKLAGTVSSIAASDNHLFLADRIVCLATKLCLIGGGILLLRRSRLALAIFILALLFCLSDSLAVLAWFLPPVPEGLSAAGRAGRIVGRAAGLWLPPVLYLIVLGHLMRPTTRREFTRKGGRNTKADAA